MSTLVYLGFMPLPASAQHHLTYPLFLYGYGARRDLPPSPTRRAANLGHFGLDSVLSHLTWSGWMSFWCTSDQTRPAPLCPGGCHSGFYLQLDAHPHPCGMRDQTLFYLTYIVPGVNFLDFSGHIGLSSPKSVPFVLHSLLYSL